MTLDRLIQKMMGAYPMLYSSRERVLDHLYCVIGNGFEWHVDGTLRSLDKLPKAKVEVKKKVSSYCHFANGFYPISSDYSAVATVPQSVRQDYLDGAFEVLDLIASARGVKEEDLQNKQMSKEIILDLETRFPGRKATGGRATIPGRLEPSMYHSSQDLLQFNLDDKVEVTFGKGYGVPKKFEGRTLTFTVDNCKEYEYRIQSKVLVLKSVSDSKDIIVVHPRDRFECLMIDLFAVNRRPYAGWKNKDISIRKVV